MAKILSPTPDNIRVAAQCVRDGGIVVCPSDTNLAITLDPWNPDAVLRAFATKNRPANKALTFFVEKPEDWRLYGETDDPDMMDAFVRKFWPGPLNIILTAKASVPRAALMGSETISIGCLSNPTATALIREVGRAVAMTSANLSGQANGVLVDLKLAVEQIGDSVDYLLEGGAINTTLASTIIDLSKEPKILRHGDITQAHLAEAHPSFAL